MEGNYLQLQQKIQNMKIGITELSRICEKKNEMIISLNEQKKDIAKKIETEQKSLDEDTNTKQALQHLYDESTTTFHQLEESASTLLHLINTSS